MLDVKRCQEPLFKEKVSEEKGVTWEKGEKVSATVYGFIAARWSETLIKAAKLKRCKKKVRRKSMATIRVVFNQGERGECRWPHDKLTMLGLEKDPNEFTTRQFKDRTLALVLALRQWFGLSEAANNAAPFDAFVDRLLIVAAANESGNNSTLGAAVRESFDAAENPTDWWTRSGSSGRPRRKSLRTKSMQSRENVAPVIGT